MTPTPFASFSVGLVAGLGAFGAYVYSDLKRTRTQARFDLENERAARQREVDGMLSRIATFSPSQEDGGAALALTSQPNIPQIEDPEPYISDEPMDDDRWQEYIEATRGVGPTLDEHPEPAPFPVT